MRTVSVRLVDLEKAVIPIGFVGENVHTQVRIDCLKIYEEYPHAAASMTVSPPRGDAYPAVIYRDGNYVIWDVTNSDLTHEGSGELQLTFTNGEEIIKTYIGRIKILRSIMPTGTIPDPLDDFLARAGAALTAIPETIDAALQAAKDSGEFDGFSPIATVTKVGNTATITITDKEGTTTVTIQDGEKGDPGEDGFSPSASVTKAGKKATVTITDKNGTTTAEINDGEDGTDGQDGFSPAASVSKSGSKATITITDKNGTTSAEVEDGTDGQDGQDGFSPTATVTKNGKKATISITDKNGTTTAEIDDGQDGQDGHDGADGFSPTASVSKSGSKATITITDKNGTTTAEVDDGQDGATGATPVISIGTVSTLAPGSSATASMDTTDPEHPVLSMGIPGGEPGNATIDDTSTANNRVWSAEKVNSLNSAIEQSKASIIEDSVADSDIAVVEDALAMPCAVEVAVEPVQDLHGQSNPYPPGGGKNLLNIPSITTLDAHGLSYSIAEDGAIKISGTASAETRFSFNTNISLSAGNYTLKMQGATSDVRWVSNGSNGFDYTSKYGDFTQTYTITGSVTIQYLFLDIANGANVNLTIYIQLESGSTATSFAPYSNICPISGWTGCNVSRTGFNVWDGETEPGYIYNGTLYSDNNYWRTKNYIPVIGGQTYYFKVSSGGQLNLFDANKTFISGVANMYESTGHIGTLPDNCRYVKFYQSASTDKNTVCINLSNSKNGTYEAFTGNTTYSITFPNPPGTVYGGTLLINRDGTGVLTVDRAYKSLTDNWSVAGNGAFYIDGKATDGYAGSSNAQNNVKSNMYPKGYCGGSTAIAVDHPKTLCTQDLNGIRFIIYDTSFTDVTAFNTYVASNPIQIVYELATPVTYNLTADEVILLHGYNNVWADTGKVINLDYYADTKMYIDRLTAPTEDDMVANNNITSGAYFVVGNRLFKASSAIAQGELIKPGTNCTETNLAEALNLLQ